MIVKNPNKTACFTGHRPKDLNGYNPEDNKELLWKLHNVIVEHIEMGLETFITGMALGVDQWAAQIVLKLKEKYPHIKLVAAIPCKNQSKKWVKESQLLWQEIIDKCNNYHYVTETEYTPACMQLRNIWMLDNSKYVIAIWSGKENGGTYNCVKSAKEKQRIITEIKP